MKVPCSCCGKVRYVEPDKEVGNLCQSCCLRSTKNHKKANSDFSAFNKLKELKEASGCSHE